ncbi:MAG: sugar nucleotide-binding protein, partial [Phycisphaerales bacterium]|nr:sugar nucleotide-binding protein [Phycisphaerales bacterium]
MIGADGQLGTDLVIALGRAGYRPLVLTHADVEVAEAESVDQELSSGRAEIVINTAALNVEASERDPLAAFRVNAIGCRNVADIACRTGMRVIHIGTDYVFDGLKREPYLELDATGPMNTYGISKLAGERYVLTADPTNCVVRSSGLYGAAGCRAKNGLNFVTTMLKLGRERGALSVVGDERLT